MKEEIIRLTTNVTGIEAENGKLKFMIENIKIVN